MNKSSFDLDQQNSNIEDKIVASLERISQAFRVLLWQESKKFSLTPIQIQLLIFLLHHTDEKRKVSYLAVEFNMTKATISETIKTLEQKSLIVKKYKAHDSRSYVIHLTQKAKLIAEQTSMFANQIQLPIENLPATEKENLHLSLLNVIHHLYKTGIITKQRMCFTCQFYSTTHNGQNHFCNLLNTALTDNEIKIDCAEHQQKQTA